MLNMRDNSNLYEKLTQMKDEWPYLNQVFVLYNNMHLASQAYNSLLDHRKSDDIFNQAYAYRSHDTYDLFDAKKRDYSINWLYTCINNAIEERVIKILSPDLLPSDPIQAIRSHLELKIFGQWLPLTDIPSRYYVNPVGDYYDTINKKMLTKYDKSVYKYPCVMISNGTKYEIHNIHRDVALLFIPNPDNLPEVNHINGVKTCNAIDNLEWCSRSYNMNHAACHGLMAVGENSSNSIYSDEQLIKAANLIFEHPDWPFKQISSLTGVSELELSRLYRKTQRKEVADQFNFPTRNTRAKGESNGNNEYTDDQIRHVCELGIKHPNWPLTKIESVTGVDATTIGRIFRKQTRLDIVKDYEFPSRDEAKRGENRSNSKFTDVQAEAVCDLLDKLITGEIKMTYEQIGSATGTNKSFVDKISRGLTRTHISQNHPFYKKKIERR